MISLYHFVSFLCLTVTPGDTKISMLGILVGPIVDPFSVRDYADSCRKEASSHRAVGPLSLLFPLFQTVCSLGWPYKNKILSMLLVLHVH